MKTHDAPLTQALRAAVLANGFPAAFADLAEVTRDDEEDRVGIVWSHQALRRGKQRRVCVAEQDMPVEMFRTALDPDAIADMIVAIRPTLPAALKHLPLPAYAEARGPVIRAGLAGARSLAVAAMDDLPHAA